MLAMVVVETRDLAATLNCECTGMTRRSRVGDVPVEISRPLPNEKKLAGISGTAENFPAKALHSSVIDSSTIMFQDFCQVG
jgi:hypothetical protein